MSSLRHWPWAGFAIDSATTPPITSNVPTIFCSTQTSARKMTANIEAKIGEEFAMGTERATPIFSIPT